MSWLGQILYKRPAHRRLHVRLGTDTGHMSSPVDEILYVTVSV
jgi:hypothetical protein